MSTKVQASSKPANSCYGVFDNDDNKIVINPNTKKPYKFEAYNDALEALRKLGYTYCNPANGTPKVAKTAFVCYTDLKEK